MKIVFRKLLERYMYCYMFFFDIKSCLISLLLSVISVCKASVVYVSSSNGDDRYDGLSPSMPFKTIGKALVVGDTICLKSGDFFFERVSLNNKHLRAYGGHTKPVISGYKRLISKSWEHVGENIWKVNLKEASFSGNGTIENSSFLNNIGCIHECESDNLHGRKLQYRNQLKENWDLWQTEHYERNETNAEDFDTLYLYLDKSPNDLILEFSVGITGVSLRNSSIEDIRIEGFGCHGITGKSNSVIRNCEIDGIGGMTQVGYKNYTCLGNGIEFYVSENIDNCLVEKCRISRCYDCGVTIQGGRCGQATPSNIIVRDNLIFNCCQGWEDFLNNDDDVVYRNCSFENNIVFNSGKTSGFNYPESRFKYCHVLGNSLKGFKGMIIRNNKFVGGNYYIGGVRPVQYKSNVWQGNICYIKRGDFILSNYGGHSDVIRVPKDRGIYDSLGAATDAAIAKYREMTGDKTTRFVIEEERKLNKRIAKLKKKYL